MRTPTPRAIVVAAVFVAALLVLQGLVASLRGHARLRTEVTTSARARVEAGRPQVAAALAAGGEAGRDAALAEAVRAGLGDVAEAFTPDGRRLGAHPAPSHPFGRVAQPRLLRGDVLAGTEPVAGGQRVVAYWLAHADGQPVILRVSSRSAALDEDLVDGRSGMAGLGVALVALLVAGLLALSPSRPAGDGSRALVAYEEAMDRLHRHGEERTLVHEAERRRMTEELRDSEALARAGELTAGMVHEVRNGLATIVGYARLVENAGDDSVAAHGRGIREECATLEVVVRRFMEYVRRERLALAPVDLSRLLARVVHREQGRRASGVDVAVAADGAGEVVADEELLERAFENLVRNALEATGPAGRVRVEARRGAAAVEVVISDEGPGLSVDVAEALRPFVTTRAGGMGLGLPLAHKVVRLHDGELELAPRRPRGLEVTVRLPLGGPRTDTEGNVRGVPSAPSASERSD